MKVKDLLDPNEEVVQWNESLYAGRREISMRLAKLLTPEERKQRKQTRIAELERELAELRAM